MTYGRDGVTDYTGRVVVPYVCLDDECARCHASEFDFDDPCPRSAAGRIMSRSIPRRPCGCYADRRHSKSNCREGLPSDPIEGLDAFYAEYHRLSQTGACDAAGASEYNRVLREWVSATRAARCSTTSRRRS